MICLILFPFLGYRACASKRAHVNTTPFAKWFISVPMRAFLLYVIPIYSRIFGVSCFLICCSLLTECFTQHDRKVLERCATNEMGLIKYSFTQVSVAILRVPSLKKHHHYSHAHTCCFLILRRTLTIVSATPPAFGCGGGH